jgi:hypothetical protein
VAGEALKIDPRSEMAIMSCLDVVECGAAGGNVNKCKKKKSERGSAVGCA